MFSAGKIWTMVAALAASVTLIPSTPLKAQDAGLSLSTMGRRAVLRNWMHSDVKDAWTSGYKGQGSHIITIDDFSSRWGYIGRMRNGYEIRRHGGWTLLQSALIAPGATLSYQDYRRGTAIRLNKDKLNVVNLSYGMFGRDGYNVRYIRWSDQERSIIDNAWTNRSVVVKSAGNDRVAMNTARSDGAKDYLASALIGAQSAIFVGALKWNGSVENPAPLAVYSNFAGDDENVQNQFLVVGVEGNKTNLYGTSFAAPVVTGYSAILGSKFKGASPDQIATRLLDTARTDTISGYSASIHGRGEASLSRALAPASIQ